LERKLSLRQVLAKLKAEDIHEMIVTDHPEVQKGQKGYPGYFQKALTELKNDMTDEEVQELETIREEWQTAGPPIDVRLR
jgi:hypothetical protein